MIVQLSESDLKLLLDKTKFSQEDIREWFEVFVEECPDGLLHRQKVLQILEGKDLFYIYYYYCTISKTLKLLYFFMANFFGCYF